MAGDKTKPLAGELLGQAGRALQKLPLYSTRRNRR